MNISKPTKFKHNIHATYDPNTGDVVLSKSKLLMTDAKQMNISGPTEFKHNIHATCDPNTGKIVLCSPKVATSDIQDDDSYDCNNCNELYYQWKRDQVKIKELQEENHFMLAMAARLCLFASNIDHCSSHENEFGNSFNGNEKMREFTESMTFTEQALTALRNDQLWCDNTMKVMNIKIEEMKKENLVLQNQLTESRQSNVNEVNVAKLEAQHQIHSAKREFDQRVERAEKELYLLKSNLIDLQNENRNLRQKMRNAKLLFTEWHTTSSRVSSALNQDMSVLELKKENEFLRRDLQQLDSDRNRLNEEVTSTMNQLLRTSDSTRLHNRPTVQQENPESVEGNDSNKKEYSKDNNSTSPGKQVSYNITAKAVNFIDKSNVKYDHRGGEITETLEDFHI